MTLIEKYNQHIVGAVTNKCAQTIKSAIDFYNLPSLTLVQWVNRKGIGAKTLRKLEASGMVSDYPYGWTKKNELKKIQFKLPEGTDKVEIKSFIDQLQRISKQINAIAKKEISRSKKLTELKAQSLACEMASDLNEANTAIVAAVKTLKFTL